MRRSEFLVTDPGLISQVLSESESGCVAMVDVDGGPYATEVNLLWFEGNLWFHSGLAGNKIQCLKQNPEVFISVVVPSSFVPSYATDAEKPCNATQFFRSVHIKGCARFITDMDTKIRVMEGFMAKMQPEGGHRPMKDFGKALAGTALVQITPENIVGKFKFGQNLSAEKRAGLIKTLESSSDPRSQEALKWISGLSNLR